MTRRNTEQALQSLASATALLRPGETFVLHCPGESFAATVATAIEEYLAATGALVSFVEPWDEPAQKRGGRLINLARAHSFPEAAKSLARSLAGIPSRTPIVIPLVPPLPSWLGGKAILRLYEQFFRTFARDGRRSIWIVTVDPAGADYVQVIKDQADFFLELFEVGNQLFAQFLKAKEVYEPGFFLPRRVTITGGDIRLGVPTVPAIASDSGVAIDLYEQTYRTVFDTLPEAIVLFSFDREYRDLNRKGVEVLGYSPSEFRQVPFRDLVAPASRVRALRALLTLRRKRSATVDVELIRKSGRQFRAGIVATRLPDGRSVVVIRDITAIRREADELQSAAASWQQMVEGSQHPQAVVVNRRIVAANMMFRGQFSWIRTDGGAQSSVSSLFGKKNAEIVRELLGSAVGTGGGAGSVSRDVSIPIPDGGARDFEISIVALPGEGASALHVTFVDITDRQRALQALAESEQRFRLLIDNSVGAVSVVRGGRFAYVNRGFLELFGHLSADTVLDQSVAVIAAPRERTTIEEKFDPRAIGDSVVRRVEISGMTSDGRRLVLEAILQAVTFSGERSVLCYWRDRSAEKNAEAQIRRRARELDIAEKVLSALHRSIDPAEVLGAGFEASLRLLGFEAGSVSVREATEFVQVIHRDLPEPVVSALTRQSATEGLLAFVSKTSEPLILTLPEYPPHLPYRSLFEAQAYQTIALVPLATGGPVDAVLLLVSRSLLDADERDPSVFDTIARHFGQALANARRYDAVRQLEEQYHRAVDALDDVVYHARPNGAMTFVGPQVERLLGYRPDEFLRSAELWRSLCHPDDRTRYGERISAPAMGAQTHTMEYRILPKGKAAYRWVREVIRGRRDERGELVALHGVVSDITDVHELQQAAARPGGLPLQLLERMHEGIAVFDSSLTCTLWNAAMTAATGVPDSEMVGRKEVGDITGFEPGVFPPLLRRATAGETVTAELTVHPPEKTDVRVLDVRVLPLKEDSGAVTGVIAIASDLTAIRGLEHAAKESEQTLRNLIDAMGDALLITDLQGRVWDVNKEFLTLTGFPRGTVIGSAFPYPWIIEDEMAKMMAWIAAMREKKFLRDFDMTWRRSDGQPIAISLNTTLLRNAAGEPVAMLNIARNISERKRLENELATKNRQIEMLNRIIGKANSTMEFSDVFQTVADEVRGLVSFDQVSVALLSEDRQSIRLFAVLNQGEPSLPVGALVPLSRTVSRVAIERGEAQVFSNLSSQKEFTPDVVSIAEGFRSEICIPILVNERILGTVSIASATEGAFTGAELSYLQPIADQIGALIDRTQLFQRVRDDSIYIHNLLNSIESVVYTVDPSYRIREVNKAWESFAALQGRDQLLEESSLIGRRLEEIVTGPGLWDELRAVLPQLFARDIDLFSRDVELEGHDVRRTFHLVVSPMIINDRVTALVFTYTDITDVKRREEEIRRRNRELIALNALSTSIGQSLNLDEVLDVASQGMLDVVGGRAVLFYLQEGTHGSPAIVRHPGFSEAMAAELDRPDGGAVLAQNVINGRSPVFISGELAHDSRLSEAERAAFAQLTVGRVACLPLASKDRVHGALLVVYGQERPFEVQDEKYLELVANNIASAIENARLYTEVQGQVRVVTSLFEMGKRLSGALDRKSVLEILSHEIRKSLPFVLFAFDVVSRTEETFERVFFVGEPELFEAGAGQLLPDDVRETVIGRRQGFLGTDAHGHPFLAVPVRSEDRITGILSLTGGSRAVYDAAHLRLVESIANLAAIALDRAAFYDDTVAKSIEIEQRNRELDDFTYVVSHDLKEPLITIEGYSKIVLKDYGATLDPQGQDFLTAVVQSTARMKSLIDDLLTLSRVGRAAAEVEPVQIGPLLADVLSDFQFTMTERHARVMLPPALPVVRYNATQLGMVFRNLIGNALKFNDKPEPTVEVRVTESDAEYTFAIADNGIGIEEQHFEKIFVIFQRLHRTDQYQGTGAGLTIVKKIIENHGGRIWLESVLGRGTTFWFTIPK